MILSRLTLRDFCLYAGEQVFELEPTRTNGRVSPVVLFGGVNGAGKTTILDAVQLVLYGKRAQCSKRFDKPYDRFLLESIHHGADSGLGASVGLTFRYASKGEEDTFEVTRSWKPTSKAVRETVRVLKNGERDEWLSENWSQVVEELIPLGIAQLCFFDAEKIRFLADDETSSRALGEAIKSLLGLDLAERLLADTEVLSGRLAKSTTTSSWSSQIEEVEFEIRKIEEKVAELVQDLAAAENPRLSAEERLRKAELGFSNAGGEHWESQQESRSRKAAIEAARRETQQRLVEVSATELPISLAKDLLHSVASRAEHERMSATHVLVLDLLQRRDQSVVEQIKAVEAFDASVVEEIAKILDADREDRRDHTSEPTRLDLSEAGVQRLRVLTGGAVAERVDEARRHLCDYDKQARLLSDVAKDLNATPAEDSIRELVDELKAASGELAGCKQEYRRVEKQLVQCRARRKELAGVLARLREKAVNKGIQDEEGRRLAKLLERTRSTMGAYLRLSTARKIDRLADRITESFRYLMRKESLVHRVAIDPETFEISLCDPDGESIAKERLSEGEKQLFAVSVLWGLARSSRRPLPAIIDTPMGRLDSKHRDQIVERYFPHASHQVIVLSTDTEIERKYFKALEPAIGRAFHLRYDEAHKRTVPEEGYFWARGRKGLVHESEADPPFGAS